MERALNDPWLWAETFLAVAAAHVVREARRWHELADARRLRDFMELA